VEFILTIGAAPINPTCVQLTLPSYLKEIDNATPPLIVKHPPRISRHPLVSPVSMVFPSPLTWFQERTDLIKVLVLTRDFDLPYHPYYWRELGLKLLRLGYPELALLRHLG
jgi:hypothetical protein